MVLADLTPVTLTFDPQIGSSVTQDGCVDLVLGGFVEAFSSYWTETVLAGLTLVTLTFDPVTIVSIGFICYPRWMCGPSLRKVGQGVLELLIRNEKVTDRQTDWHMQINMPSLIRRGDIKIGQNEIILRLNCFQKFWLNILCLVCRQDHDVQVILNIDWGTWKVR